MLNRFRHRRSAVTFDVGAAGVRAHQVCGRGSQVALCDALALELPQPDDADGKKPPAVDIARIARIVEQGRFLGRDVALMLSPPDVQVSTLRLPEKVLRLDPDRVQQALKVEVSRDTRLAPADLEVRYWPLPPGHYQGLNLMAVALPVALATQWFEQCRQHRLHLRRIDIAPRAQVQLARRMWTPDEKELWGILDLGVRRATFTAVVGDVPTYVRCLPASVEGWNRRLAEGLDVAPAVADRLKRQYGILPQVRGARETASGWQSMRPEDLPCVLFGLLRGALDDLVGEINKCFAYVLKSFPDLKSGRLLLAGGGANLGGLTDFLAAQLGLPVTRLTTETDADLSAWQDPLPALRFRPEAATSVGGALLDLEAA